VPLPPASAPQEDILRGDELTAPGQVHVDSNARFEGEVEWYLHRWPRFFAKFQDLAEEPTTQRALLNGDVDIKRG
jgi:hypothetical protein